MENMKWYGPSQVPTAKHESYPELTATILSEKYHGPALDISPIYARKKRVGWYYL